MANERPRAWKSGRGASFAGVIRWVLSGRKTLGARVGFTGVRSISSILPERLHGPNDRGGRHGRGRPPSLIVATTLLCLVQGCLIPPLAPAAEVPEPAAPLHKVEIIPIGGLSLELQVPTRSAPGNPWLWVGEFGWHVAYLNARDQYGSPRAMEAWEKVYEELHGKRGLASRPALLGISRGGLYVNAWTRLHPERVSVLYLDNGVCDPRSWPGGYQLMEKGKGSKEDWTRFRTEFNFGSDEEAVEKSVRPIEGLATAIEKGVFLISVHGTADPVVPYVDNAAHLVEFWRKSGGRFAVFPKEGGKHHPHGLPDPAPLIELLVKYGDLQTKEVP